MEETPGQLVAFSREATHSINQIWDWNAQKFGAGHADRYFQFLVNEIELLAAEPNRGRRIPNRSQWRSFVITSRPKRHG